MRTFARHQQSVMSVDFHPANDDVVCSCDSDGEVRMWSVDKGACTRVFKVGGFQVLLYGFFSFLILSKVNKYMACGNPLEIILGGNGSIMVSFSR